MKVLVEWDIPREAITEVLTNFGSAPLSDYQGEWAKGMTTLGRWHDAATGRGLAVVETDDYANVTRFVATQNSIANFRLSIVHDDEETHAICSQLVS